MIILDAMRFPCRRRAAGNNTGNNLIIIQKISLDNSSTIVMQVVKLIEGIRNSTTPTDHHTSTSRPTYLGLSTHPLLYYNPQRYSSSR
jgi:hypothetical protein